MLLEPTGLRFFLNLSRRPDRRERTEAQFKALGIAVERYEALDATDVDFDPTQWTTPGRQAVATGFCDMVREARRRNAPFVGTFEDDLGFAPGFRQKVAELVLPEDWDLLYLGGSHLRPGRVVNDTIVKATQIIGNHALFINAKAYDRVLKAVATPGLGHTVDKDIRLSRLPATGAHVYAAASNLVWQVPDYSDLQARDVRYFHIDGKQLNKVIHEH